MVSVAVEFDYDAELSDELSIRAGDLITDVKQLDGGWWEGKLGGRRGLFPDNFVKILSQDGSTSGSSSKKLTNGTEDDQVELRKPAVKQCRVLFSYSPAHEDELELKLDEVIEFLGEVEDGWWRGTLNGKTGVFPSNFVEVVTPTAENSKPPLWSRTVVESKNKQNEKVPETPTKEPSRISNLIREVEAKAKSNEAISSFAGRRRNNSSTENVNPKAAGEKQTSAVAAPSKPASSATPAGEAHNAPKLPPKPVKEQCLVLFPYTALNEDELTLAEGQVITIISKEVEDKGWWKGELDGKVGVFPDNFVKILAHVQPAPQQQKVSDESKQKKPLRPPNSPAVAAALKDAKLSSPSKDSSRRSSLSNVGDDEKPSSLNNRTSGGSIKVPITSTKEPRKLLSGSRDSLIKTRQSSFKTANTSKPKPPPAQSKPTTNVSAASSRLSSSATSSSTSKLLTRPLQQPASSSTDQLDFDFVEVAGEKLAHPTADRVKAPKRRPPSSVFVKESARTSNHAFESRVTPTAFLSKSLEDVAADGQKKTPPALEANKNRLSFKFVRQVKDVFGGLTNGAVASPEATKTNGEKTDGTSTKKVIPPPKPPQSVDDYKKPEWLEELSRKQAVRKSGLFREQKDEHVDLAKPQVPAKPTQIKDDIRRSVTSTKRQPSLDSPTTPQPPITTQSTVGSPTHEQPPPTLPDLEKLEIIERVRRLEKLQEEYETTLRSLREELQEERAQRQRAEERLLKVQSERG